jgi:hypothetical protein
VGQIRFERGTARNRTWRGLERRPYDWASSWKGAIWWKQFHRIKERFPLLRPRLYLPYAELQAIAVL